MFCSAERHAREGALASQTAELKACFCATNRIDGIEVRPVDSDRRARLLSLVGTRIEAITRREGAFRVPESVGWFLTDG